MADSLINELFDKPPDGGVALPDNGDGGGGCARPDGPQHPELIRKLLGGLGRTSHTLVGVDKSCTHAFFESPESKFFEIKLEGLAKEGVKVSDKCGQKAKKTHKDSWPIGDKLWPPRDQLITKTELEKKYRSTESELAPAAEGGGGSSSFAVASTPAHKIAPAEPSSNSTVDSEAAVNANAKARANPADRALRAEVRKALLDFAPGGDGASAVAEHFGLLQAATSRKSSAAVAQANLPSEYMDHKPEPLGIACDSLSLEYRANTLYGSSSSTTVNKIQQGTNPPLTDPRVEIKKLDPYGHARIPSYQAMYVLDDKKVELCRFNLMWTDDVASLSKAREDMDDAESQKYDAELSSMTDLITAIAWKKNKIGSLKAGCVFDAIEIAANLQLGERVIPSTDKTGSMPSFLRMCNAFSEAVQDCDMDLAEELSNNSLLLLADDHKLVLESCEGFHNFYDAYQSFCSEYGMPFDQADLSFANLARHGIVKFWDAERDDLYVGGFALLVKPSAWPRDSTDYGGGGFGGKKIGRIPRAKGFHPSHPFHELSPRVRKRLRKDLGDNLYSKPSHFFEAKRIALECVR